MENVFLVLIMAMLEMYIFGVDNSSSHHIDNLKNNFLVLGEGPTKVLMVILLQQKKILY